MIAFLRKARLWLLRTCVETSVSGSRACIETEMVSNINRRNLVVETVGSALRKRSPTMVSKLQWRPGTRFLEIWMFLQRIVVNCGLWQRIGDLLEPQYWFWNARWLLSQVTRALELIWDFILDHVLETNHGHNESTLTRNDMRALQLIEDEIWSYRYPELGLIALGLIGTPE